MDKTTIMKNLQGVEYLQAHFERYHDVQIMIFTSDPIKKLLQRFTHVFHLYLSNQISEFNGDNLGETNMLSLLFNHSIDV